MYWVIKASGCNECNIIRDGTEGLGILLQSTYTTNED